MANLRALVEVMDALKGDADPQGVGRLIMEEVVICSPSSRPYHFLIDI